MDVNQVRAMALFACLALSFVDIAASKSFTCDKECKEAAEKVKSTLDESVEPCDDFYKFACGNFDKTVDDIPYGEGSYTSDTPIIEHMYDLGKAMMAEQKDAESFETDEKLKKIYEACTNLDGQKPPGLDQMKEVVSKLGGWPVVQGAAATPSKKWHEVMLIGNELGLEPNYFIEAYQTDSDSGLTFWLNPEWPILGEKTPANKVKSYKEYMEKAAVLFGATPTYAKQEMGKVYDFQDELAKLATSPGHGYGVYRLDALEKLFSPIGLSVKKFLQTLVGASSKGKKLQDADEVTVIAFEYFRKAADVFKRTEEKTILNYIIWRAVMSKMTSLGEKARTLANTYQEMANGVKPEPRWRECLTLVGFNTYYSPLAGATGSLFIRKQFKGHYAKPVEDMFKTMKKSFLDIIQPTKWMSGKIKQKALDKIRAQQIVVHAPSELSDKTEVDKAFADLSGLSPTEHVKNLLAISKFSHKQMYGLIEDNVGKDHWTRQMIQAVPQLVYNRPNNLIKILAGSLVGSIYDSKLPEYMNYGVFGAVQVATSISEAFDRTGSSGWLTDPGFKSNLDCFVKQYSKTVIPDLPGGKLNALEHQFEIFVDNSGLRLAYEAYGDYVANTLKGQQEAKLPGLEKYSPEQMFWIGYGQTSCAVYTKEALKNAASGVAGLPTNIRTMHLKNRKEFFTDFKCGPKALMHPKKTCEMWG